MLDYKELTYIHNLRIVKNKKKNSMGDFSIKL